MLKGKKSKMKKMEKLRLILDNPYDPKIKKFFSKDDKNLEIIHRRILGKSSISTTQASSESLAKKPKEIEPSITVYKKIENETKLKTKQFEVTKQASDTEDLYDVENVIIPKPEFSEIKVKEITKEVELEKKLDEKEENIIEVVPEFEKSEKITETFTPLEKIITREPSYIDDKGKKTVFKEAEIDEIYRREAIPYPDRIQIYKPITIIEMWAFTFTLGVVAVSGLFLLRDWLFLNFGVYGNKLIPTPIDTQNIHIWFGLLFTTIGLIHISAHIFSKKKDILPKKTLRDFKAFLHSGMYLIGLARREDYESSSIFYGRQRITYLALVYILGLTVLTGLFNYLNILSNDLILVHIIPAGLGIMVLLFQFLITIRKHDITSLKCAFISGKLPRWYVKKNHPIWYKKIMAERESILETSPNSLSTQTNKTLMEGGSNLNNAVFKFAQLLNDQPDEEDIKTIIRELQANLPSDELKRIIELAEELKDEQKTKYEPQKSEEESTELGETSNKH